MASASQPAGLDASISSLNSVDNDTSVPSSANLDTQPSKWTSASTSLTASPAQSRDPSPARLAKAVGRISRAPASTSTSPVQSRKNSAHDFSPSRTRSNVPPSTIPRQLSSTSIPSLPPHPSGPDTILRAPVPRKSPGTNQETSKDSPRWPISPRLKSPPPNFVRPTATSSARRSEPEIPPLINVQRATPSPHVEPSSQSASDAETEESQLSSGMKTPVRGPSNGSSTLETVEEVSQPNTPRPGIDAAIKKLEETSTTQSTTQTKPSDAIAASFKSSSNAATSESGSDSGSVKTNTRRSSAAAPPPLLQNRQSSSTLKFGGRGQASGESSSRNMTVETEEVKDMPQLSLIPSAGGQRVSGSLRTRPSNETIKPKKEKKKHSRKTASVASGNASSKADIFEAKVASAVEEANSSDSDETFVYDSNPPDAERPRRYHSRTPSAASMASQVDRNGMRSIHAVLDGTTHNPVKKSMKFVNTYAGNGNESVQGDDDGRGTGRSNAGSARGTARHHHHHQGRWGRNNGSNHLSLFDNESPFPNATRSKLSGSNLRQPSNPPSPRFNPNAVWPLSGKRQLALSHGYDMSDTTPGADDERTPLLQSGTVRTARSGRNRRNMPLRNIEAQTYHRNPSFLNRFASCLVLTVMLLLVVTGGIGFMFATSQPLTDVELLNIGTVIVSEQELIFDLTVQAHNPNVVVVMIDSADIEVFAKSRHAGNDSEWWRRPHDDDFTILDDPPDDPPDFDDPDDDAPSPNMRLGNVHVITNPLTYEGSFFQRGSTTSTGELRLAQPGNTTESGTERWERIISDEFTLVIKGVLKYTLPLSQKIRKVSISGKTLVKPNAANNPRIQPTEPEVSISDSSTAGAA
ncbi:vacuolar segregation subunit 7-domain-containing protein [Astrocystis sublimbata]|nr:vacuolar segregation subunit 7-domain-containing protein [Astrocystis sublimbata]